MLLKIFILLNNAHFVPKPVIKPRQGPEKLEVYVEGVILDRKRKIKTQVFLIVKPLECINLAIAVV